MKLLLASIVLALGLTQGQLASQAQEENLSLTFQGKCQLELTGLQLPQKCLGRFGNFAFTSGKSLFIFETMENGQNAVFLLSGSRSKQLSDKSFVVFLDTLEIVFDNKQQKSPVQGQCNFNIISSQKSKIDCNAENSNKVRININFLAETRPKVKKF